MSKVTIEVFNRGFTLKLPNRRNPHYLVPEELATKLSEALKTGDHQTVSAIVGEVTKNAKKTDSGVYVYPPEYSPLPEQMRDLLGL